MTVRVNKPSFNIREKLSELGRKFGLKGSELAAAETVQEARDLVSAGRKNLIINGDMRIAQRGTSFAAASSGSYAADRWMYEKSSNAVVTISQNTAWNNGPYWAHSIKVETTTARSSTATSNFQQFLYKIEANDFGRFRFGTAEAKPFTFSFWVKSNKTGDFPASFQNYNGTRVFPVKYNINKAGTWEKKVVVVPGDTSGSWNLYGNSIGIRFTLMWSMGSNFTDGTEGAWAATTGYADLTTCAGDQMDVVGATLEFAHVQLEVGRNATDFEHRTYGEELALCQRYYEKFSADDGNGGYATFCGGGKSSNTVIVAEPVFRVPKRAVGATMTWGGDIRMGGVAGVYDITINSIQNAQLGIHGGYIVLVITSSTNPANNTDGYRIEGSGDPNAYIAFSSEL